MKPSRIDSIIQTPQRRLKLMLGAQIFWILLVAVLGAWWGHLILRNAARIAALEAASGIQSIAALARDNWHRTQRMLFWESMVFFVLVVVSAIFLFWIYWRDMKRSRSLQVFFASVTHELRTPLTSIRLQAESIAENCENDPSQHDLVQRLLEDTVRLEAQVERTLELARVEGGGPVYLQPLELRPWLEHWVRSRGLDYNRRASFDLSGVHPDTILEVDPTALQVILKNLLENAVRHARKTPVHITMATREVSNRRVELIFRDDGEGFQGDPHELGRLFHRGSQSQGTGVGLYLIQALMRRMNGETRIRTDRGFEVSLDLSASLAGTAPGSGDSP